MSTSFLGRAWDYVDLARQAFKLRASSQESIRDAARSHLAQRMGRLRGLPQKIGQIMSMNTATGDEADPFAPLTNAAPALPFDEIAPLIEQAWSATLADTVSYIDQCGLAASLGQVHRAKLKDGRDVAIKVRYPGIREAVMNDLSVLGWIAAPMRVLRGGFDLADYRAAILRDIEEELDYRVEAMHQSRYASRAAELPGFRVPRVITRLSNESVLVSEWCENESIDVAATWSIDSRRTIARSLLTGTLHMLLRHGYVHADPHPGNVRFASPDQIVLLDYGSVARFGESHRTALLALIQMTRNQHGDPYPALLELGFNETLLAPLRAKLPALCAVLFEPFCTSAPYPLAEWRRAERIADILGDDRWNFRVSGPAELLFVLRVFGGLCYYLGRLGVDVNWSAAIEPHLAHSRDAVSQWLKSAGNSSRNEFASLARHLRVRVSQAGTTKVALTFPATAIDDLDQLMDADLRARLSRSSIDLASLVRGARQTGYAPQTVFELPETATARGVRVWLE